MYLKNICQIHPNTPIKYKYKYKYIILWFFKYKYIQIQIFTYLNTNTNTNTYLTPALYLNDFCDEKVKLPISKTDESITPVTEKFSMPDKAAP